MYYKECLSGYSQFNTDTFILRLSTIRLAIFLGIGVILNTCQQAGLRLVQISHQRKTFFNGGLLRMGLGVLQPEGRSCSGGAAVKQFPLFYHRHITVINLTWPQIETSPHRCASCQPLCLKKVKGNT